MPTKKPRMMVTVDDELYERMISYSTERGISLSKAATELLMMGLGDHSETSTTHHHEMVKLSPSDLKFAQEYSNLTMFSKKMVREFVRLEKRRSDYDSTDVEN